MIASTMTIKHKRTIYLIIGIAFWLILWESLSHLVGIYYVLPSFTQTLAALFNLLLNGEFYLTVFLSLGRIALGLLLGIALGVLLGFLSHFSELAYYITHPILSVIRSTPVASIIILLWFFISKDYIPIAIGLFMVGPIIWQSTYDALHIKNKELSEVAEIFCLSPRKKIKILVLPTLIKYLFPAIVTSSGLAWKAGVAAEIITYTKMSIGFEIAESKNMLEGADMFAWSATVILLSVGIESLIKFVVRRLQKKWD